MSNQPGAESTVANFNESSESAYLLAQLKKEEEKYNDL